MMDLIYGMGMEELWLLKTSSGEKGKKLGKMFSSFSHPVCDAGSNGLLHQKPKPMADRAKLDFELRKNNHAECPWYKLHKAGV